MNTDPTQSAPSLNSATLRDEQLKSLTNQIVHLPDPIEDDNWGNHAGGWRTYHDWMLEMRGKILDLLISWPNYAPGLKIRLASAVYNKAASGQIRKASYFYKEPEKAILYKKTHPLFKLEDFLAFEGGSEYEISTIYGSRQAMLIAFVQLFEWLTQDDEKLVPAYPKFADFKGHIRIPDHWIAAVGADEAQALGMVTHIDKSLIGEFSLPPLQFISNILPHVKSLEPLVVIQPTSTTYTPKEKTFANLLKTPFTETDLTRLLIDLEVVDGDSARCIWEGQKLGGRARGPISAFPAAFRVLKEAGHLRGTAAQWGRAAQLLYGVDLGSKALGYKTDSETGNESNVFHQYVEQAELWLESWPD